LSFSPLPLSTLFPYTTLFRSPRAARGRAGARLPLLPLQRRDGAPRRRAADGDLPELPQPDPQRVRDRRRRDPEDPRLPREGTAGDRKSTRLNSSHVKISYAVF